MSTKQKVTRKWVNVMDRVVEVKATVRTVPQVKVVK